MNARQDIAYQSRPNARAADLAHIPGDVGWPVLGMLPRLLRSYMPTMQAVYEKYGSVSRTHNAMHPGILVLGPDECREVLLNRDQNFSNKMGYYDIHEWFGPAIMLRDFDDHKMQRRLFQTAFKTSAMNSYGAISNDVIERQLADWVRLRDMAFLPAIQQILVGIGLQAFYGIRPEGGDVERLVDAFNDIINKGMLSVLRINLPPFAYYYGIQGRDYITRYFKPLIAEKRAGDHQDLMSHLCRERDDEDNYFSDDDILANAIFLFFASYDTTTTALSHLVMHLACDEALQSSLRDECRSVAKARLQYDELDQLEQVGFALNEAMRLYPSSPLMMRRTIDECELGGYRIPANTKVYISPPMVHRNPTVWSSPERFDPKRFAPGREEHKKHPFGYIPFGGGAHKCIGMHFALQNAKLFMFHFLRNFRFRAPDGYQPASVTLPVPRPVKGLPLRLEPIG
jgi:cytochrome P450